MKLNLINTVLIEIYFPTCLIDELGVTKNNFFLSGVHRSVKENPEGVEVDFRVK